MQLTYVSIEGEDVTARVNTEKVVSLIYEVSGGVVIDFFSGYSTEKSPIEICLQVNHEPLHLVLGENNFYYWSGSGFQYKLESSYVVSQLINEVEAAVTK